MYFSCANPGVHPSCAAAPQGSRPTQPRRRAAGGGAAGPARALPLSRPRPCPSGPALHPQQPPLKSGPGGGAQGGRGQLEGRTPTSPAGAPGRPPLPRAGLGGWGGHGERGTPRGFRRGRRGCVCAAGGRAGRRHGSGKFLTLPKPAPRPMRSGDT